MKQTINLIRKRYFTGWVLLLTGVLVFIFGILKELSIQSRPFNPRVITGFGFVLIFAGVGVLIRYKSALKDEKTAKRILIDTTDERTVLIRSKAGHRAFWVAMIIIYALLQYVSFASNRSVPALNEDLLWYILSAAVVIPFGVYVAGIMVGERKH